MNIDIKLYFIPIGNRPIIEEKMEGIKNSKEASIKFELQLIWNSLNSKKTVNDQKQIYFSQVDKNTSIKIAFRDYSCFG